MKFGGSSVADAERILAAAEIVRGRLALRPVVVVSALAGVTDLLVRTVGEARAGARDAVEPILADLIRRHRWAAAGAVSGAGRRHDLELVLDASIEELRQLLRSVRVLGEGTPRVYDAVVAFGELLSSRIVATAFVDRGLPALLVDARDVVVTDGNHGAAEPDLAATGRRAAEHVAPALAQGQVPVLGGFIGRSAEGHATTLGRGGSDTSAAVLGSVLDAETIEIWTDVDGILSADPRRVPEARTRAAVSFAEAAELAFYGAKVLHPASIAPAVRRGIAVRVLNATAPGGEGTLVLAEVAPGAPPVASIASRGGVSAVRVRSRTLRADPSFVTRALAAFEGAALLPDLVVASELAIGVAVPSGPAVSALRGSLEAVGDVEIDEGRGIVCVVGSGLAPGGAPRARVVASLAAHGPEMLVSGASPTSVAALLPEARLDACVRALHREFFEGDAG